MKNDIGHAKKVLLGIGMFFIMLCSNLTQAQTTVFEQLTGTWLFDDATSFATIEPATRAHMDTVPQLKTQLLSAYIGRKVFFGSDGAYKVILSDGRGASGNWKLTPSGEISLTDPQGNVSYQQIGALENNRLVLIPIVSKGFKGIIKERHFVKL
ncbi:hypothetical protein [uncultured Croceitalea sp.]|uniref:hypothetical protein n=1 Tax=uncultured Croceitalea sp. TaxID=1798908 RepID=UPI00374E41B9